MLVKFINENIQIPKEVEDNNIRGRVRVKFIVDKTGELKNAEVVDVVAYSIDSNSIEEYLEKEDPICRKLSREALRLVGEMPSWDAGQIKGKPVAVYKWLTISFKSQKLTLKEDNISDGLVFIVVQQMPQFPGGNDALKRYIAQNTNYPFEAQKRGIVGICYLKFVIATDGSI